MKKILIVDDSKKWVDYHKSIIEELYPDQFEIECAYSAKEGFDKITLNIDNPYNIILTDMQMETDFAPLYAGEWFIKQIQSFKEYLNTKIIIISATSNIKFIAEKYNVNYIPKYTCQSPESYKVLI